MFIGSRWIFLTHLASPQPATDIINRMPRVDRLVMVAGVLQDDIVQPEKRLSDLEPNALHRSYQINAIGPICYW